jgi:hypothetical protein
MMVDADSVQNLQEQVDALEISLGSAAAVVGGFDGEVRKLRAALAETGKDVNTLEQGLSRGLRRAFDGVVFDGMKLSDALRTVANSMINTAYNAAVKPVADHFGGLLAQGVSGMMSGLLPFANGASFAQGRVMTFANGGVVTSPTTFPMRGGTGLMGEAGPEAIMPLTRGPDGRLGVQAQSGGKSVTVVMNISTPDVEGFRRSEGQIAARMARALGQGQRYR